MAQSREETLKQLEDSRCQAMIAADVDSLDRLLSEDLIWTHGSGSVDDKKALLNRIAEKSTVYLTVERMEEKYLFTKNTSLATGIAEMNVTLNGEVRKLRNRYLDVWFLTNGAWRLVAWQSTPLPS